MKKPDKKCWGTVLKLSSNRTFSTYLDFVSILLQRYLNDIKWDLSNLVN